MKIALVVLNPETGELGGCLSQAKSFAVYDTNHHKMSQLGLPNGLGFHHVAVALSHFLKKNDVNALGALDLGPKAKAYLEEQGIKWFLADKHLSLEDNFTSIIKQLKNE